MTSHGTSKVHRGTVMSSSSIPWLSHLGSWPPRLYSSLSSLPCHMLMLSLWVLSLPQNLAPQTIVCRDRRMLNSYNYLQQFYLSSSHQIDVVCKMEVTEISWAYLDWAGEPLQGLLRDVFEEECWWQKTPLVYPHTGLVGRCSHLTSIECCWVACLIQRL